MTKQTELKNLLQDLHRATCEHLLATKNFALVSERGRLVKAVDAAEKRVFSFFDALDAKLQNNARAYKNLQDQRDYLAKELDTALAAVRKAKAELQQSSQNVPFDDKRAYAGDAIEVVDDDGNWHERPYVGCYMQSPYVLNVVFLVDGAPKHVDAPSVRMKSAPTKELQMFATVYRADGCASGYLSMTTDVMPLIPGAKVLVANAPVTITVAE
jgi:hypothetical protein